MKKGTWILLLLLAVSSLTACDIIVEGGNIVRGSGDVVQESREVSGFDRVELATIGTLIIENGARTSLTVEAEDNLLQYIQTRVQGGKLLIDVEQGASITPTRPIRYRLTISDLREITLSSSGDAEAPSMQAQEFDIQIHSSGSLAMDGIDADRVGITVTSSGNVDLDVVSASQLSIDIESSGDVTIGGGSADEQDITISSSGNYEARDVQSIRVEARLSSSGSATVRVSEVLRGRLTSSGSLNYVGNPQLDVETTSSGDVNRIGD
jgi:hypothetical protein